jgi:hypothetical protein
VAQAQNKTGGDDDSRAQRRNASHTQF